MSAICLKCREEFSEEDHECLELMTIDELHKHLTDEISAKLAKLRGESTNKD